jgi:hypothetical protein
MADKEYNIKVGSTADTTGIEQAEQAIQQVEASTAAVSGAAEQASRGFGGMLDGTTPRLDEATEAAAELEQGLEAIREKVAEVTEETEAAAEQSSDLDENVRQITRAQKAQALAQIAGEVGKIANRFREAAAEVEEFDQAAAASMRQTADRIEKVTGAVSTLALGFAVGGPLGAGVAALGLSINALLDAFQAAEVAAIKSAAAQKQAMEDAAEATRKASAAEKERQSLFASLDIVTTMERELAGIQNANSELERQVSLLRTKRGLENEVLQAQDRANLAEVDRAEATGKMTPAEADAQRVTIEAAARKRVRDQRKQEAVEDARLAAVQAKQKIDELNRAQEAEKRIIEEQEALQDRAAKLSAAAQKQADFMTGLPATEGDLALAREYAQELETIRKQIVTFEDAANQVRDQITAAKSAADVATRDMQQQYDIAAEVARAMNQLEAEDTRATAAQTGTRAAKSEAARRDAEQRANDTAAREAAAREAANLRDAQDIARDLPPLLPPGLTPRVTKGFETLAARLEDGAQGKELEQLLGPLETLAAAVMQRDQVRGTRLEQMARRIEALAEQIRRNPPQ